MTTLFGGGFVETGEMPHFSEEFEVTRKTWELPNSLSKGIVGLIEDCIGPSNLETSLSKGRERLTEDGIGSTTSSTNGWLEEDSWEAIGGYCQEI